MAIASINLKDNDKTRAQFMTNEWATDYREEKANKKNPNKWRKENILHINWNGVEWQRYNEFVCVHTSQFFNQIKCINVINSVNYMNMNLIWIDSQWIDMHCTCAL